MTSLTTLYEEQDYRRLKITVRIAGFTLQTVRAVSYSYARGRVPTCNITIPNPPTTPITAWTNGRRSAVDVYLGFNGFDTKVFTGSVESVSRNERACVIACVGKSRLLDSTFARTIPVTFVGNANDIVEDLLDEAGINDYVVDLPAWDVGSEIPRTLEFSSFGEAINHLSEIDGSVWHELPSGQIRVGVFDPMPAPSPFRTYFSITPGPAGSEIQPDGIDDAALRPRLRSVDVQEYPREVRNRVSVRGGVKPDGNEIETTAQGSSPWIPNPPRYSDHVFSNDLIDTEEKAASVALRHYNLHNRLETVLQVRVSGDPQVFLCGTVRIEDPNFSGATGRWFIESYTTSLSSSGFETSMELRGGGPAAGSTPELDPFASFTWTNSDVTSPAEGAIPSAKFQQFVPSTLPGAPAGGGQGVLVTYDGRGSQDFDGSIVDWDWAGTADGGWTASGSVVGRTYDPATDSSDTVTLTVTDNDGNTDPLTLNVLIEPTTENPTADDTVPGAAGDMGGQLMIAQLFVATDTHATASQDGGETWTDLSKASAGVSGNFISVSARVGYEDWTVVAIYGTDAGEIVRTTDWCATGTLITTLAGGPRIEDIWADTFVPGTFWAATSTGKLYRSVDNGLTWGLYHDNAIWGATPIYAVATPGDAIFAYGGNSSDPSSLIRADFGRTGSFVSISIAGALATALTAAGAGHHVIAAASREGSDLAIMFDTGVSPRLWYTSDIFGDGTGWTAATGLDAVDGKALAPGYIGPGELVAIVADLTSFYATNGVTFAAKGDAPSQINHLFWEVGQLGAYVGAADDDVVKSNDGAVTWGVVRDLTALDAAAVGRKISFIVAPLQPAQANLLVIGTDYQKLTAGNAWENGGPVFGGVNAAHLENHSQGDGIMIHKDSAVSFAYSLGVYDDASWLPMASVAGADFFLRTTRDAGGRFWLTTAETSTSPDQQNLYFTDTPNGAWTGADVGNAPEDNTAEGAFAGLVAHPSDQNRIVMGYREDTNNLMKVRITTDRSTFTTRTVSSEAIFIGGGGAKLFWLAPNRLVAVYVTRTNPRHLHVRVSDDDAVTWTTKLDLTLPSNAAHGYFITGVQGGGFGPIFFALDRDAGNGTNLIYRSASGDSWEALDSPVADTTPIQGMAYDLTLDELYILWPSRVDKVASAGTVAAAGWLGAFTTLPAVDSGSLYEGIAVLP